MPITDARRLSPSAQEALRLRVIQAVESGMRKADAARTFSVSRMAIHTWVLRRRKGGLRALKARKRGRPSQPLRLKPWQCAQVARLIVHRCPDQLQLPFALWTREAVRALILREFRVRLSIWTVGRYLRRWGFTPQKPLRRAYERDEVAVRKWLAEEYPKIHADAGHQDAEIHWGDEMGVRSDHQTGTSYGRRGQTPVIRGTGQRFRCNMLSTVTNRGTLRFMIFREKFTAPVLLRFLDRLLRTVHRPVFLIVDRHPVHRSARVKRWMEDHADRIRLFFLPPYSPDLNPDELLNNDVKSNAVGRKRPTTLPDMEHGMRSHLRLRQRNPDTVKSFFRHPTVRYAAGEL